MVRNYKGLVLYTIAASREYPPPRELPVETDAGMISYYIGFDGWAQGCRADPVQLFRDEWFEGQDSVHV
jgi:hypothetical protein